MEPTGSSEILSICYSTNVSPQKTVATLSICVPFVLKKGIPQLQILASFLKHMLCVQHCQRDKAIHAMSWKFKSNACGFMLPHKIQFLRKTQLEKGYSKPFIKQIEVNKPLSAVLLIVNPIHHTVQIWRTESKSSVRCWLSFEDGNEESWFLVSCVKHGCNFWCSNVENCMAFYVH